MARGSVPVGPNGEPAITDKAPLFSIVYPDTRLSPFVTNRNLFDGSAVRAIGVFPVKGKPVISAKAPEFGSIESAETVDEDAFVTYRNFWAVSVAARSGT